MATLRAVRFSDAGIAAWGERLAEGIARGMQLDREMLRSGALHAAGGRPSAARGPAGGRQDAARPQPRGQHRRALRADPGHRRPAPHRRAGDDDLARQHRDLRVPPRADLRQHRPRRRAEPGDAENAVGAARGDGRAAGHRRRPGAPAAAAVHGDRHPEPDRGLRRHLRAAARPARPLHDPALARLSLRRRRRPTCSTRRRPRRWRRSPTSTRRPRRSPPWPRSRRAGRCSNTSSRCSTRPDATR